MSVNRIAWRLQKAKALRDYIGRYISGSKTIVQNNSAKRRASRPECFLTIRKTSSKEQKNTYVTIQTTLKHLVSSLNSRQTVHKRYRAASHWQNGQESEVAIESPYIYRLISDAWQLTALLCFCIVALRAL